MKTLLTLILISTATVHAEQLFDSDGNGTAMTLEAYMPTSPEHVQKAMKDNIESLGYMWDKSAKTYYPFCRDGIILTGTTIFTPVPKIKYGVLILSIQENCSDIIYYPSAPGPTYHIVSSPESAAFLLREAKNNAGMNTTYNGKLYNIYLETYSVSEIPIPTITFK